MAATIFSPLGRPMAQYTCAVQPPVPFGGDGHRMSSPWAVQCLRRPACHLPGPHFGLLHMSYCRPFLWAAMATACPLAGPSSALVQTELCSAPPAGLVSVLLFRSSFRFFVPFVFSVPLLRYSFQLVVSRLFSSPFLFLCFRSSAIFVTFGAVGFSEVSVCCSGFLTFS